MAEQFLGMVEVLNEASNKATITLDGNDGVIALFNKEGKSLAYIVGQEAYLRLGGNGAGGDVSVRNKDGEQTILLDGDGGDIYLGGNGAGGDVSVRNKDGEQTFFLHGDSGYVLLGGNGANGSVSVQNSAGKETIDLNGYSGSIRLGGNGADGDVSVRNSAGRETIHLDGDSGDIILQNADCAEEFGVAESEQIEPGTVMVLDQEDTLRQSTEAYDKRVAGVVSGAGDYKAGIVLDKKPAQTNRIPVALMGKVYCKVDAYDSPIKVGDLLTTSSTPGYAMKASDPLKTFGAVIGKAMRQIESGRGVIPILVALQ